jgi:hypothetical protein
MVAKNIWATKQRESGSACDGESLYCGVNFLA